MAWTGSKIFRQFLADILTQTAPFDLDTHTITIALFDGTIVPAQDVIATAAAYGGGVWSATGGQTGTPQVYHTGQWAQGGVNITSPTVDVGTAATVKFTTATNPVSGTAATMSNINGVLCYDNTLSANPVTDQAICYNYFGAPVAVSAGKLTVTIPAGGIFSLSL